MSPFRLSKVFLLLAVFSLVIATTTATPVKRHSAWQRQIAAVQATTAAKVGYPPAGFRPHIPFELPNERKPKVLPPDAPTTETPFGIVPTRSSESDGSTVATPRVFEPAQTEPNALFPPLDSDGAHVVVTVPSAVDVEVIIDQDGKVGGGSEEEGQKEGDGEIKIEGKVEIEKIPDDEKLGEGEPQVKESETDVNDQEHENDGNAKRREGEDDQIETHTPADTYGAPEFGDNDNGIKGTNGNSNDNEIDNSVELIEKPAEQFQPPNKDFREFAAAPTNDGAIRDAEKPPVLDVPVSANSNGNGNGNAFSDVSIEIETNESKLLPAPTYGPPTAVDGRLPANTYGAPGGSDATTNNSDTETAFAGEANELEPAAEEVELAAEQIELLSGLSDLKSGRLIFVPADGTNLRQIYFANVHGHGAKSGHLLQI